MKPQTMVRRVKDYLRLRRALGFQLQTQGITLLQFAKEFDSSIHRGPLTTEVVLRWSNQPRLARSTRAKRLSVVRCFARYLATRDDQTEVPGRHLAPKVCFRQQPYIYTKQDVAQLLAATDQLKPTYPLKRMVYRTLFGILACTGLRVSEARKLNAAHVDLQRGILRIEQTKFKKSRLTPLHPTATRALRVYAQARYGRLNVRDDSPFFITKKGSRLPYSAIRQTFDKLRLVLGWTSGSLDRPRRRIHDLRHTFACQRLLAWYRNGEDVQHLIAALSTYLGHGKVSDTYWYLSSTPELLAIAGARFEQFADSKTEEQS